MHSLLFCFWECMFTSPNLSQAPVNLHWFLWAFAKLRETTISFVTCVCLSICLSVCLSPLDTFSLNLIFQYLSKICREDSRVTSKVTVKVIPQQAEVALGVPVRLRPRIFLTFGTTRVVGRQPYVPAAITLGEIRGTHFQRLSRPQSHGKKIPSDTTGNQSRDRPTSSAVP